jgi:hypothetical protein
MDLNRSSQPSLNKLKQQRVRRTAQLKTTIQSQIVSLITLSHGTVRKADCACRRSDRLKVQFAAVHESAIGTKRTFGECRSMSAFGGKADIDLTTLIDLDHSAQSMGLGNVSEVPPLHRAAKKKFSGEEIRWPPRALRLLDRRASRPALGRRRPRRPEAANR